MPNLNKLMRLREKVDRMKREADKASGALAETMKRLRKEFGCDSLKEARAMLRILEKKEQRAKAEAEKALAEFEELDRAED